MGIILCGLNGCGKSTLGHALADALGWCFIDNEDLYFAKTDPDQPYVAQRSQEEVGRLLLAEITKDEHFVFAAVRGNYATAVLPHYQAAVLLDVPRKVRPAALRGSFRRTRPPRRRPVRKRNGVFRPHQPPPGGLCRPLAGTARTPRVACGRHSPRPGEYSAHHILPAGPFDHLTAKKPCFPMRRHGFLRFGSFTLDHIDRAVITGSAASSVFSPPWRKMTVSTPSPARTCMSSGKASSL